MGPTIILDKCALQSLSRDEVVSLGTCFYLNAPPILIQEIIADLKKRKELMRSPEHEVEVLANKLRSCFGSTYINMHYRDICEDEMLGHSVKMCRRTMIYDGKHVRLPDGQWGTFIDEPPELAWLRRWSGGRFSPEDEAFAEEWRLASSKLSIEPFLKEARRAAKGFTKPKSMSDVCGLVDRFLATGQQAHFVQSAMDRLNLPKDVANRALIRWREQRQPSLQEFAPYTFFVYRTILIHLGGLVHGLLGTKATNALDLEYLFYLPFCEVLCSGDKFVVEMSRAVLANDQLFIDRETLKSDMKAVAEVRRAETEENRQQLIASFANGPEQRFKHPLWQRLTKPWERKSGKPGPKLTKEGLQKLQDDYRYMQEAIRRGDFS